MRVLTILSAVFYFALPGFAQLPPRPVPVATAALDSQSFLLSYEIHRVEPALTLSRSQLDNARMLIDLNPFYKADWVKAYDVVTVTAVKNGQTQKATGKNDQLTREQLQLMQTADAGSRIDVQVAYLPDNNLRSNSLKQMEFYFTVDPVQSAAYPKGSEALDQYLQKAGLAQLDFDLFRMHHLTAVRFTVNALGKIEQVQLAESSGHASIDDQLLAAIRNMPDWLPARYADGQPTQQTFVLAIGHMQSCVINLLNIRRGL
ncbi:MAG: energy transducer TonB [Bacteroidota bacterium]